MAETLSRHRLPTLWRWILGVGVSVIALFLTVALWNLLPVAWQLSIFPLGLPLAIGPGLLAGLGVVSPRVVRYWAYSVLLVSGATWAFNYWTEKTDDPFLAILLLIPLVWGLALAFAVGLGLAVGVAVSRWRQDRLHALHPLAVYGVLAALAWLVWSIGITGRPQPPADAAMEVNFRQHREQFEQLVRMFNKDTMMSGISHEFTSPSFTNPYTDTPSAMELGFTESRWNQYRSLFQQLELKHGIGRYPDGTILLRYWSYGISITGEWKGYVYSKEPLEPLLDSLDDVDVSDRLGVRYKELGENWYLYYEWDH